ncbi:hypothetical protein ABT297_06475 [Dactylosporangium sp. NPDC000555]|uniref:hypothetical protein n=1 Tax=Dactylosporangium sp. NPDC000555 TaxID=3154260 RepID=UPI00332FDCE5
MQRNFLRNPLPLGAGICAVCRGPVEPRFEFCYPCRQHRYASGGRLADVVVPIAYAVKNGQHAHNLAAYKAPYPRSWHSEASPPSVSCFFGNIGNVLPKRLAGH